VADYYTHETFEVTGYWVPPCEALLDALTKTDRLPGSVVWEKLSADYLLIHVYGQGSRSTAKRSRRSSASEPFPDRGDDMTPQDKFLAELANHAEKLAALLKDPQPGLMSWALMVGPHAQFIADWWGGKFKGKHPNL
jgi:hypothetical protein